MPADKPSLAELVANIAREASERPLAEVANMARAFLEDRRFVLSLSGDGPCECPRCFINRALLALLPVAEAARRVKEHRDPYATGNEWLANNALDVALTALDKEFPR